MGTRWTQRSPPGWSTGWRRPAHTSHARSPWTPRPWVAPPARRPTSHLLAALDHAAGAVLAHHQLDGAPEEVTGFPPLLAGLDLTGVTVTADTLHSKRDAAKSW
jgi:hypothetical protein